MGLIGLIGLMSFNVSGFQGFSVSVFHFDLYLLTFALFICVLQLDYIGFSSLKSCLLNHFSFCVLCFSFTQRKHKTLNAE
jgi:hypothetical protein